MIAATVPQPPTDLVMPKAAELVFTIGGAVPLVILLVIALRQLHAGKPLLLACMVGGLAASLFEPFVDVLGMVYLTENNSIHTFTLLGRTMPLFVPVIYPWYIGGFAYLTCQALTKGITRRNLMLLFGAFVLTNFALEAPGLLTDVYTYYGKQPLNPWGHPMWWGCENAFTAIAGGTAVYGLTRLFPRGGLAYLGVIPLLFISEGISNAGTGWPMYATLNDNKGWGYTYAAAVITISLVLYCVWLIGTMAERIAPPVASGQPAAIAHTSPDATVLV
ncbi:MAG TPA: hypothetical protein VGJ14_00505 [Sporichthyaceae bacterium]